MNASDRPFKQNRAAALRAGALFEITATARQVVQRHQTPKRTICHIDLHFHFPGGQESEAISVVATLDTAAQPSSLHLAMVDEDRRRRKDRLVPPPLPEDFRPRMPMRTSKW